MRIEPIEKTDKTGRRVLLRSPEVADAAEMIRYLKTTSGETPYLIRDPDEISVSPELEGEFLYQRLEAERECMIVAVVDSEIAGTCTVMKAEPHRRAAHRCEIGIALYQAFTGCGIGRILMDHALTLAKAFGYEQAELQVASGNKPAIGLYQSLGFQQYGVLPRNMKYQDGSYADMLWMMKVL